MPAINRFGEDRVDEGRNAERDEEIEFFLQYSDRQLAVACADDDEKNSKIMSIVNQHFQGRPLSSRQRWCLAKQCVDFGKRIEK